MPKNVTLTVDNPLQRRVHQSGKLRVRFAQEWFHNFRCFNLLVGALRHFSGEDCKRDSQFSSQWMLRMQTAMQTVHLRPETRCPWDHPRMPCHLPSLLRNLWKQNTLVDGNVLNLEHPFLPFSLICPTSVGGISVHVSWCSGPYFIFWFLGKLVWKRNNSAA